MHDPRVPLGPERARREQLLDLEDELTQLEDAAKEPDLSGWLEPMEASHA